MTGAPRLQGTRSTPPLPSVMAPVARWRIAREPGFGAALLGFVPLALWALITLLTWRARGLFDWLGIDYGFFWAAARAFVSGGPTSAYDLHAIAASIQPLAAWYGPAAGPLQIGPTPYPPIFVALFVPFTLPSPPIGFLLWTLANLALALYVLVGLAARFPARRWAVIAPALGFFPLAYTFITGQVTVLLLVGLYRAYRDFEDGRELRAGLWAGALLIKPQYAMILGLVLLFKRRWAAVAGMAAVGLFLLLSSLAMLGPSGLAAYVRMFGYAAGFRAVDPIVRPAFMVNWRAFLINFVPWLSEAQGLALTTALSVITASTLVFVWRGVWRPRSERFALQMLATMLVTVLTAFHSHPHGAALILVPGMVAAAHGSMPRLVRHAWKLGLYLPPFLPFVLPLLPVTLPSMIANNSVPMVLFAVMAAALAAICATAISRWSDESSQTQWRQPPGPRVARPAASTRSAP